MIARLAYPAIHLVCSADKASRALITPDDVIWAEAGWRALRRGVESCWRWAAAGTGHIPILEAFVDDVSGETLQRTLYQAVFKGCQEIVGVVLTGNVDVHEDDDFVLRMAGEKGHIEIVELLLEAGANVHASNDQAIDLAAREGCIDVMKLLLGAATFGCNAMGEALTSAADKGHVEIVKLVLDRAVGGFPEEEGESLGWDGFKGQALRYAATWGHVEVVRALLRANTDIHHEDDAALCEAAAYGKVEVLEALLEAGAGHLDKALRVAATSGTVQTVKMLLKAGARMHVDGSPYRNSALGIAAAKGRTGMVKAMLQEKPDIDVCNEALIDAAIGGDAKIVRALLKVADVHYDGDAALAYAAEEGIWTSLRAMQETGTDPAGSDHAIGRALERARLARLFALDDIVLFLLKFLEENDVSYWRVPGYEKYYTTRKGRK
ncbi:hypothetical protein HDV00_008963 [Rhizophlyctis rosea]|nr:hypothetical protein HDV00_008963 [Rhizophlyctis rosea]